MRDRRWYSALNVIAHFHGDLKPQVIDGRVLKKAEEMWAAAVMLVGMQEVEGRQYWMQPVSDAEGSPDVRTIRRMERTDGKAPHYTYQDVEVVTYTSASVGENLPEFLLRTKLSPLKAYDALTTILVYAKQAVQSPPRAEWDAVLTSVSNIAPVMLIGRSHETEPIYTLMQVHPDRHPIIEFNLVELLEKQKYTGVIQLSRGVKDSTETREGEDHCPFESLGIKCKDLKSGQ